MMFTPLEGRRHVKVTDRHTGVDYARALKDLLSPVKFSQLTEQAWSFGVSKEADLPVFWRCGWVFLQIDRIALA